VSDLRGFVLEQDVVYVGGGNTASLLAVWRAHGLDAILREALDAGAVLCGVSAGMNFWFEASTTDSFGAEIEALHDGLGFVAGSACPHYDGEAQRRPLYHRLVAAGFPSGYAADDGAALHFDATGAFVEAVASREGARGYRVERRPDGAAVEQALPTRYLW
jgi:dipeptidase E